MTIYLASRRDTTNQALGLYDLGTDETVARFQPVVLDEDFIGAGHTATFPVAGSPVAGYPWVQKQQKTGGSPAAAVVANSIGGITALSLDATSEKQSSALYSNDQLNWDVTKGLVFETRAAFSVLPTGVVEIVMGLQTAWIDGPDNGAEYLRFQASASGAINAQLYDGTLTAVSVATGVTLVAGVFHNFRIDARDVTHICFYIDGTQVATAAFTGTGTAAVMQPMFEVYKASGVGVGTLQVDSIQIGMNRS